MFMLGGFVKSVCVYGDDDRDNEFCRTKDPISVGF